ncbi:nuclear transport factor 2 family protein [Amphritea sp. HPY]|uniref:nuclear transport factor 2 family protein n=1 Tax=Amphritea sp. HPY TaxID=3421652 RepID=UPI003D7D3702
MAKTEAQLVEQIITDYFDGLYAADVAKLRNAFHADAFLKAPGLRRSRDEWLQAVANRPVPKHEGESYRFNILSMDVIGEQAMVKLECPLFEKFYIDFIGLLKENGQWKIVNKMYCDIAQ